MSSVQSRKRKLSPPSTPVIAEVDAGGEWTKVERRKAKKAKKMDAKLNTAAPRLLYSAGQLTQRKDAVGIDDIRDLVLHMVADAPPPAWLRVENAHAITHVVALLLPGITPDLLDLPPPPTSVMTNPHLPLSIPPPSPDSALPWVASTFSHACPTRAPGDKLRMHSVLAEFFQGPVSGEEKKRRLQVRIAAEREQQKDPARYVLSLEDMVDNDYPVPSYMADVFAKPPGWVETPQDNSPGTPKIYGIDCEMCLTEDGKELARVCVIDYETQKVVYDQLVRPQKPIVDYLTRWSGITAAALAPVTTTFADVQSHILALLSATPTPMLLGHSLESDLKALKIAHPRCIDTALIFHHPRGRPMKPGLAWLTKKWCGRVIQDRGDGGHDPEEDARACMELLKKKVENGPGYGEFRMDFESIFERMARAPAKGGVAIRTAVVDHGNPAAMHGSKASTAVGCASDDEVLQGVLDTVQSHAFVFARFTELADARGWITPKVTGDATLEPAPEVVPPALPTVLTGLNARLARLHEALPARTALVLFTGHADPRRMAALNARRAAFEEAVRAGVAPGDLVEEKRWSAQDGRELEAEVERAKRGLLFLCVKAGGG